MSTVGSGLTVKIAILDVAAAQGAAPVTTQRYCYVFIVTGGAVMVKVAAVAPL